MSMQSLLMQVRLGSAGNSLAADCIIALRTRAVPGVRTAGGSGRASLSASGTFESSPPLQRWDPIAYEIASAL
jgi:hypothetical protein